VDRLAAVLIVLSVACSSPLGERDGVPAAVATPAGAASSAQTIDHLAPRRDSTGAAPSRFEWTAVEGADSYVFNLSNDIDYVVWRQVNLRQPTVAWPPQLKVEPGTYFWTVAALSDGRVVAESGRAAFVVVE
jgi:hypothetical protein